MLKLFYVIFMNLHRAPYMIPRMRAEAEHCGDRCGKPAKAGRIHDVSEPSGQI